MNSHVDLLAQAKARLPLPALMALLGHGDHAKKSARCPWHDDASASFSVYQRADGSWAFKCFAGCGEGNEPGYLAKHRSLSNADACREFIKLAGVTPSPSTQKSQPPFDWGTHVAALEKEHQIRFGQWRGYSDEFFAWLVACKLVGLFSGEYIAFPIEDEERNIVGCHYRLQDGSWRYFPTGLGTRPLVMGQSQTAGSILIFESQWDALAVMDKLGWHKPDGVPDAAIIVTRGAANGKLVAGLCSPSAVAYAFLQNDPPNLKSGKVPAEEWFKDVSASAGCTVLRVITPAPHDDPNVWTKAGATADDLWLAIRTALPLTAPPPKNVSPPSITLPEESDEPEATPFPLDALPPTMATMIAAVARTERVPLALPAVCALGVASAAIGAGLEVISGPNRVTRANLYFLGSAESGSGKSETFRLIAAPLVEHQTRMIEMWKLKIFPQLQAEIRVLDKEIGTLEKKAAKTTDPGERDRMMGELEYKLARKDGLVARSAMPCVIAQDVTTERLVVLLRDNGEVLFSASADARKLVDNLMGRYNPGKTTDESLYLSAYSGDFVRVDRQGRDAVILNKPALSLCWFVQPDLLATMLGEQSLSVSGFLPRLLICHTKAAPRRIEGEAQTLSESVRGNWTQLVGDLLATFHAADKPERINPTPEAVAVLNDFHNRVVDRRITDLSDVGAFAARYAENAWRLAVVLHAALHGAKAGEHPLEYETAANAVRVVEWFTVSQLDILAKGRHSAATKVQDEVLDLLDTNVERKGVDYVSARDVHRARITSTADAAKALLARMEADGLLVGEDITPTHGGKTTRIFRRTTNPVLKETKTK